VLRVTTHHATLVRSSALTPARQAWPVVDLPSPEGWKAE